MNYKYTKNIFYKIRFLKNCLHDMIYEKLIIFWIKSLSVESVKKMI